MRSRRRVPILLLSLRADEAGKLEVLDLGADDYLGKPFGIEELLARVLALLRRSSQAGPRPKKFRLGPVEIDLGEDSVRRSGEDVRLTRAAWALLEALADHPGGCSPTGGSQERRPR